MTNNSPTGRIFRDPLVDLCIGGLSDERMVPAFHPAKNVPEVTIQETAPANPGENESTAANLLVDADFSAIEARILGGMTKGHVLIFMGGRLPGMSTMRDAMGSLAHAGGAAAERLKDAVKALEEQKNLEPLRNLAQEHLLLYGSSAWPDLKTKVETYRRLYGLEQDKGPVTHEELRGLMSMNKRLDDTEMAEATGFDPVEPIIVPGGAHKKKAKAQWKNEKRGGYFKR